MYFNITDKLITKEEDEYPALTFEDSSKSVFLTNINESINIISFECVFFTEEFSIFVFLLLISSSDFWNF